MKFLHIAAYNLKVIFRNIKSNIILFILPLAFMGIFSFAFGQKPSETTFSIAVLKNESQVFKQYMKSLEELKTPSGKNLFTTIYFEKEEEALVEVEKSKFALLLKYDPSKQLQQRKDNGDTAIIIPASSIVVKGDLTSTTFNASFGIIDRFTNEFFKLPKKEGAQLESFTISNGNGSPFQFLVPGLIVYGILITIPYVAQTLTQMREKKYLLRYYTSRVSAFDILFGSLLSQTAISLIQTAILFMSAVSYGFSPKGSIIFALLIAIPTNFFAVGVGLIIGGLVKKSEASGNVGSLVSIILGFVSGSFLILPEIVFIKDFFGTTLKLTDLFPSAHATEALKSVLLFGRGFETIIIETIILLVSSVIILAIGVVIFQKNLLREVD